MITDVVEFLRSCRDHDHVLYVSKASKGVLRNLKVRLESGMISRLWGKDIVVVVVVATFMNKLISTSFSCDWPRLCLADKIGTGVVVGC